MSRLIVITVVSVTLIIVLAGVVATIADEFTEKEKERWQNEYMTVVNKGRELWVSPDLGTNGVSCAQCHPNAANTHPETYPKFQQQLGKVVAFRDMINWCLMNPLEGEPLELDGADMVAMEAYAHYERRGVPLDPGKH